MTPQMLSADLLLHGRLGQPMDPHAYHLHDVAAQIRAARDTRWPAHLRRWISRKVAERLMRTRRTLRTSSAAKPGEA